MTINLFMLKQPWLWRCGKTLQFTTVVVMKTAYFTKHLTLLFSVHTHQLKLRVVYRHDKIADICVCYTIVLMGNQTM